METSRAWSADLCTTTRPTALSAVHAAVMIEVLRKLYDAGALADELTQQ